MQNTIRGLLETFGLVLGKGAGGRFAVLVEDALLERPTLRFSIEPLLAIWAGDLASHPRGGRRDASAVAGDGQSRCRLLPVDDDARRRSDPPWGCGGPTAPHGSLAFTSAVDDPTRFHDSRAVGAYFGLTPRRYQSGKSDHTGKISRAGDSLQRSLLFEAAQSLAFRSTRAPALKAWFEALAARIGRKKALVALARKLAVIMHAMLVNGRDFDETLQATAAAAA